MLTTYLKMLKLKSTRNLGILLGISDNFFKIKFYFDSTIISNTLRKTCSLISRMRQIIIIKEYPKV